MTNPDDQERDALGRIRAWASHYKDEARSQQRGAMKLIYEEAEAALAAREELPEGFREEDIEKLRVQEEHYRQSREEGDYSAAREDTERPDDDPMPVFTIQGKDLLAVPVILYYQRNVEGLWDSAQAHWVEQARLEIEAWQKRNPDRCKYADHKHVPVVQDTEQEHVEPVE